MRTLTEVGMSQVSEHEQALSSYALERIREIDGVRIYGGCKLINRTERLGVIPFEVADYPHALISAILGYEWGIGVRNGCFCAHPYVEHLLHINTEEIRHYFANIRNGNQTNLPGFVRISLALYNT
ncbi:MAG: aminotransferase class V-fold PLP-dependent enzyme [Verrucomicrobiota bacterium]